MLTARDQQIRAETGLITPERLMALRKALRERAADAHVRAQEEGIDERYAASFRGKRRAYGEAADLVEALLAGNAMRAPRWSSARTRARAFVERRAIRRADERAGRIPIEREVRGPADPGGAE